jgi:Protein of unknown function (DUF3047)
MRRLLLGSILTALAVTLAVGAEPPTVVVEDWSRQPQGRSGIPDGWSGHGWGNPKYDFTVVADGADKVLHLRSRGDNSTISKEIKVDVTRSPLMVWRWKVVTLPPGADCRHKATDDEAAQIYVTFPRYPVQFRARVIGYVWDTTAPVGTIAQSESSSLVTYVVVRSGAAELGRWLTETRNVHDDYKRIYGEAPAQEVGVVSVAIDSNDTRSSAESYIGTILFRKP